MAEVNTSNSASSAWRHPAVLIGGGVAVAGLGLAAGMMLRNPSSSQAEALAQQAAMSASSSAAAEPVANQAVKELQVPARVVHKPVSSHVAETTHRVRSEERDIERRPAAVCATCGVVEGVRAVQQKGAGTGLGVVAGGVLGGAVGNQMGKGNGKTAMTVLGALGGGLLGNEVEKTQRANTVYEVTVRMDDGSVRTFTQGTEPVPGTRVEWDGQTFHAVGG